VSRCMLFSLMRGSQCGLMVRMRSSARSACTGVISALGWSDRVDRCSVSLRRDGAYVVDCCGGGACVGEASVILRREGELRMFRPPRRRLKVDRSSSTLRVADRTSEPRLDKRAEFSNREAQIVRQYHSAGGGLRPHPFTSSTTRALCTRRLHDSSARGYTACPPSVSRSRCEVYATICRAESRFRRRSRLALLRSDESGSAALSSRGATGLFRAGLRSTLCRCRCARDGTARLDLYQRVVRRSSTGSASDAVGPSPRTRTRPATLRRDGAHSVSSRSRTCSNTRRCIDAVDQSQKIVAPMDRGAAFRIVGLRRTLVVDVVFSSSYTPWCFANDTGPGGGGGRGDAR